MSQTSQTVYQYDIAGLYQGPTEAEESPLEPGVYHLPARTTAIPPPDEWLEHQWPRWNGAEWQIINRPRAPEPAPAADPAEKLRTFLEENPDVAELVGAS